MRLWTVLLMGCVLACAGARSDESNAYKPGAGPYPVRSVERLVLHDSARDKELEVAIHYPDGAGPFPVIVWSHGALGSKDNYRVLTERWASHGYVVIQPTHADSRQLGGRIRDVRTFRGWEERPRDVSFVLDSLDEIESRERALAGTLDRQQIGVGGHSFGAHTAQLLAGAHTFAGSEERSFADPRVKAAMVLSGQGPGEMLRPGSWQSVNGPLFVMTGSKDGPTRTGQPAEWRRQPYGLSPPGDKYLVWVVGLDHGYGGISGARRLRIARNDAHVAYTQMATLAFWDAYLKGSKAARDYLRSDRLGALSEGAVELQHK